MQQPRIRSTRAASSPLAGSAAAVESSPAPLVAHVVYRFDIGGLENLKTYLVGDINTKVDRASMALSLEVREPLMDHPLVEWLSNLPPDFKLRNGEGKLLLEKALAPYLPPEILYRPKMASRGGGTTVRRCGRC